MTRDDERKLWEAYTVLSNLLNRPKHQLAMEEVNDIVELFQAVMRNILNELPIDPGTKMKATVYLEDYCDKFMNDRNKI